MKLIQVDKKGRASLGRPPKGVIGYDRQDRPDGSILLVPIVGVPAHEVWVLRNREVLESIDRGMKQAQSGKLKDLGRFGAYADDNDKDKE
ncbi:MAG: hypothetical protein M5U26_23260 [Planctomycetota bacterium]|nr:hypothetical protein [Planctomycetota bacterium]